MIKLIMYYTLIFHCIAEAVLFSKLLDIKVREFMVKKKDDGKRDGENKRKSHIDRNKIEENVTICTIILFSTQKKAIRKICRNFSS